MADVKNPPEGFPQISPYLLYEDVDAAIDWLTGAFGLEQRVRMPKPDGKTMHAELGMGSGVVMMGSPGGGFRNPKHLGGATQLVYVYVEDVNTHYERAKAAGATILRELADQFYGDRNYTAEDPEGHQWTFTQHVRDIGPEDMHP
ncbi:MAG TPA: VOC family protein [Acidimicrobiales bacterium]|nr:VOC family protein [Acidimicrobiales bacterium]